jgi:hypothetical protein
VLQNRYAHAVIFNRGQRFAVSHGSKLEIHQFRIDKGRTRAELLEKIQLDGPAFALAAANDALVVDCHCKCESVIERVMEGGRRQLISAGDMVREVIVVSDSVALNIDATRSLPARLRIHDLRSGKVRRVLDVQGEEKTITAAHDGKHVILVDRAQTRTWLVDPDRTECDSLGQRFNGVAAVSVAGGVLFA